MIIRYGSLSKYTYFSVITPHHDIAEILLKVALNTKNQSINQLYCATSDIIFNLLPRYSGRSRYTALIDLLLFNVKAAIFQLCA